MTLPSGEPKDGDFVAYLAQIERQQLAQVPAAAPAAADHAPKGAAAAQQPAAAAKPKPRTNVAGGIVLGVIGLFFLMLGLAGNGGWISLALGAFLLWRAAKFVADEVRRPLSDARTLMAAKFPPGGKRE